MRISGFLYPTSRTSGASLVRPTDAGARRHSPVRKARRARTNANEQPPPNDTPDLAAPSVANGAPRTKATGEANATRPERRHLNTKGRAIPSALGDPTTPRCRGHPARWAAGLSVATPSDHREAQNERSHAHRDEQPTEQTHGTSHRRHQKIRWGGPSPVQHLGVSHPISTLYALIRPIPNHR